MRSTRMPFGFHSVFRVMPANVVFISFVVSCVCVCGYMFVCVYIVSWCWFWFMFLLLLCVCLFFVLRIDEGVHVFAAFCHIFRWNATWMNRYISQNRHDFNAAFFSRGSTAWFLLYISFIASSQSFSYALLSLDHSFYTMIRFIYFLLVSTLKIKSNKRRNGSFFVLNLKKKTNMHKTKFETI